MMNTLHIPLTVYIAPAAMNPAGAVRTLRDTIADKLPEAEAARLDAIGDLARVEAALQAMKAKIDELDEWLSEHDVPHKP